MIPDARLQLPNKSAWAKIDHMNWGLAGHEWAVSLFKEQILQNRLRHAYLFTRSQRYRPQNNRGQAGAGAELRSTAFARRTLPHLYCM